MRPITVTRMIDAPIEAVFHIVADVGGFSKAVPHITKVELLSEQQNGAGTRFRETRLMKGREATTELEITEYQPPQRARFVADSHGTVWDTVFSLSESNGKTRLEMVMDARAYKLLPRLMNPLIRKVVAKAVASDMDCVKSYCESASGQS